MDQRHNLDIKIIALTLDPRQGNVTGLVRCCNILLKAKKGLLLEFIKSETTRCPLVSKLGLELNCLESPEVVKDPGPPNRSWTFSATGPPELGGRRRSRAGAFAARLLRRLLHML